MLLTEVTFQAVPYRGHIQSGLFPGRMVRVRGTVNPYPQRQVFQ